MAPYSVNLNSNCDQKQSLCSFSERDITITTHQYHILLVRLMARQKPVEERKKGQGRTKEEDEFDKKGNYIFTRTKIDINLVNMALLSLLILIC